MRPTWKAYTALTIGVLCIGLSAIFVKIAAVPGSVSAFYRVFIASLVLAPWWLLRKPALPPRRALQATVLGGVFFAGDLVLWNTALLLTGAGVATLLANNAPLWVGLAAWLFLHERLTRNFWVGLFVALAGMTLIVVGSGLTSPGDTMGNLLAIAASFLYAAYLLTTQRIRAGMDTLTFMTISVGAGAVLLGALCLVLGVPMAGFSLNTWLALLGLGLVSQLRSSLPMSGPLIIDVTNAITTSATKIRSSISRYSRATDARMISMAPRAFKPTPTSNAARGTSPPSQAPRPAPPILPNVAMRMTTQTNPKSKLATKFTLSPMETKYKGAKMLMAN
jgi:drug/metabolite transporter (DMT)-like permease